MSARLVLVLVLALMSPVAASARTFGFDFLSGPSVAVSPEALIFAPDFAGKPINARVVLDLPTLRNLDYSVSFSNGLLYGETGGRIVGAKLLGISFRDAQNLFGGIHITTNARGRLTSMFYFFGQDTPDAQVGLRTAAWGDASRTWYEARGRWTLTEDPAPIPLPAGAVLLSLPLAGLAGLAGRRASKRRLASLTLGRG